MSNNLLKSRITKIIFIFNYISLYLSRKNIYHYLIILLFIFYLISILLLNINKIIIINYALI